MPTKTPAKKASVAKANALQKPLQPSQDLAAVVGSKPVPRGQVVSKVWDYIRSHKLQNPENRREILADDKLRKSSCTFRRVISGSLTLVFLNLT